MVDERKARRLQQARVRAGYAHPIDAARAFGWNPETYRQHENATRGFRNDRALRYARAFGVSLNWLLTGSERDVPPPAKVVGCVTIGGWVIPAPAMQADIPEEVPAPVTGLPETRAVVVLDDSMAPRFRAREALHFAVAGRPIAECVGEDCFVRLANGREVVRRVFLAEDGRVYLEAFNAPPILDAAVAFASPIIAWQKWPPPHLAGD